MSDKREKNSPTRVNFALQGGGAHGAFTWGVLDRMLEEAEKGTIEIGDVSGTSAGAMNGAVLVNGLIKGGPKEARKQLKNFWKRIAEAAHEAPLQIPLFGEVKKGADEWADMMPPALQQNVKLMNEIGLATFLGWSQALKPYFSKMPQTLSPYDLPFDTRVSITDLLEELIDFEALQQNENHHLFVTATDVEEATARNFSGQDLNANSLMASACLPEVFPAVEIDGRYYWDGGYSANPSLLPLIVGRKQADLMVVQVSPLERKGVPKSLPDIQERAREIGFHAPFRRAISQVEMLNQILAHGKLNNNNRMPLKPINLHVVGADNRMAKYDQASKLNPDIKFLKELFELGRQSATEWLAEKGQDIGQKSTYASNISKPTLHGDQGCESTSCQIISAHEYGDGAAGLLSMLYNVDAASPSEDTPESTAEENRDAKPEKQKQHRNRRPKTLSPT